MNPHADPTLIVGEVVNAVGNGFAQVRILEIVNADFLGFALRLPLLAGVLESPQQFLLFRVHRHHRLPAFLQAPHLAVEVLELGIAIGVRGAFSGFAIGLQAVAHLAQQRRHGARADRMAQPAQFLC